MLWDAVEGATDYDVNYKPAVGGRWTNQPHRGVRLHNTIHDLAPNTEYRWAVRAENSDGASAWIHGPNFTTRPSQEDDSSDVSPAPTNLRLENLTDTSVRFVWDAVEGATDYDVNYKEIDGKWTNIPHRGTATYRDFDGLEPGKEYRWAVKADRGKEKSKWAFGEKFTTVNVTSGPLIFQTPGSSERDRDILMSIYKSSSSDAFKEYTNGTWHAEAPTWYWEGVHTNEDGRVTMLSLVGLDGPIPAELVLLDQLWSLRIYASDSHQLSGDIPMWLWQMESLRELHLSKHLSTRQ